MYRRFALAALAGLALLLLGAVGLLNAAQAAPPADAFARASFERVWTRTDWLVKFAGLSRAWYWGPDPRRATYEVFDEAPGHIRLVQYFDKSRMEPNILTGQPTPEPNSKWAVTNGLLVVELIAGQQQLGAARFVPAGPADIPLAFDVDDANGPTYRRSAACRTRPPSTTPPTIIPARK